MILKKYFLLLLFFCSPTLALGCNHDGVETLSVQLYKITDQFKNDDKFFKEQNNQAMRVIRSVCILPRNKVREFIVLYMKKCKYDEGYGTSGLHNYVHDKCLFYIYVLNRCYFHVPSYINLYHRSVQEQNLWILYRDPADRNDYVYTLWPLKIDKDGNFHIVKMPTTINSISTGPSYKPLVDFDSLRAHFSLRTSKSH